MNLATSLFTDPPQGSDKRSRREESWYPAINTPSITLIESARIASNALLPCGTVSSGINVRESGNHHNVANKLADLFLTGAGHSNVSFTLPLPCRCLPVSAAMMSVCEARILIPIYGVPFRIVRLCLFPEKRKGISVCQAMI